MRVRVRVKLAWLSTVHLMSWKTVPTTSSPSVSCAEMYAWPWGWGRSKWGWGRGEGWGCGVGVGQGRRRRS